MILERSRAGPKLDPVFLSTPCQIIRLWIAILAASLANLWLEWLLRCGCGEGSGLADDGASIVIVHESASVLYPRMTDPYAYIIGSSSGPKCLMIRFLISDSACSYTQFRRSLLSLI